MVSPFRISPFMSESSNSATLCTLALEQPRMAAEVSTMNRNRLSECFALRGAASAGQGGAAKKSAARSKGRAAKNLFIGSAAFLGATF